MKFLIFFFAFCTMGLNAQNVLYLYGDISAEGDIPSGEKEPFHQMRLSDTSNLGLSQLKAALDAIQIHIREAYDAEVILNTETLQKWDVLILGSNQRKFTSEEASAVKQWVESGGGLIAWSDSAFGGHYGKVGIDNTLGRDSDNILTKPFGMYFLTDNGGGNYLIHEYTENHFINKQQKDGGIRFRGEGVSFVRVSPPARILAKAQEGGLGGRMRVNKIDAPFNSSTDAALAIAEVGQGRVVGLFDRNMLWNAGAGSRLSHSDNREFAQRMILWAAGVEDESRIPQSNTISPSTRNTPPVLTIEHTLSDDGKTLYPKATYLDNDGDGLEPEITWKIKKGSPQATFENNNPNTLTPVITLTEKGKYSFVATLKDGEFSIRKHITVTRK